MITQKIIARTDSLKLDKIISRYGEDSMRQVVFIIVRPEPDSEDLIPITIPEDAVGSFRILKPSGNFVIVPMNKSVLSTGETAFDVVLPASANTSKGSGYYDIRITSETDKYYYTAQGDFIIDDNIISDEVLEDVSEVNGLIFPDDFLTVEDNVAYIDDDTISTDRTWSSNKINDEIEAHAGGDVSKTVSGNPVTFTDGAAAPLVKCVTQITGSQDLHGYDKPWVGGAGKNKLPLPAEQTINGVTLTHLPDGGIKLTGTPTGNAYFDCFAGTFDTTAYAGYRFKASYIGSSNGISFRISESNRVTMQDLYDNNVINDMGDNLYFALRVAYNATIPSGGLIIYPMLLSPSETNYDFAPYSNICPISGYSSVVVNVAPTEIDTPATYTIALGDTYYSGQIDAVRGVLVADKAGVVFDGSNDESWSMTNPASGITRFYIGVSDIDTSTPDSQTADIKSNMYEAGTYSSGSLPRITGRYNIAQINIFVRGTISVSDWRTYLSSNNLQVVYPLDTPIEIPLNPTVISSLLGNNAMWTDGDNLEVEYITQRFQPLIDSIKQL